MSSWNIGKDDVSEETQALKDRLSSKDTQCASLQSQLMKRESELEELRLTLNETLHKLTREADRALQLEQDFIHCSEDLKNEKISNHNTETALLAAQEKIREEELASRELHATIETLSHRSDGFDFVKAKFEKEKGVLEARVRELEIDMKQLSAQPALLTAHHRTGRPRSSSVNNFRLTDLERDLNEVRASAAKKDADLRSANAKLARVQHDLINLENEKIAAEKHMQVQLRDLEALLEDKEEELERLKELGDDSTREREEELLKRVEEDDAKIMALEMLLRDSGDMGSMKAASEKAEQRLRMEMQHVREAETRNIELVVEKEEALDELEHSRIEVVRLSQLVGEKQSRIDLLTIQEQELTGRLASASKRATELESELNKPNSPLDPEATLDADAPHQSIHGAANDRADVPPQDHQETVATYVERLLGAVDRLRTERDGLKRDLQFLEAENRFAVEALETKIAVADRDHDVEGLASQLRESCAREQEKERKIKSLGLTATAMTAVICHLQSEAELAIACCADTATQLAAIQHLVADGNRASEDKDAMLADLDVKQAAVEARLTDTLRELTEANAQHQVLTSQVERLEAKERELIEQSQSAKAVHKETQDALAQSEEQLANLTKSLEDADDQRNSLCLQLTNLQNDLFAAQQDLADAEARYSELQMHQLAALPVDGATRALREQIEELEERVLRRTEQIGVHQHDIRRLETNLRLQEERVGEMTAELETLAAQKEAMVEDCADAREARDEAVQRVETLEMEVEALEGRVDELEGCVEGLRGLERKREGELVAMVGVVAQTVSQSRDAIQRMKDGAAANETQVVQRAVQAETKQALALEDLNKLRLQHECTIRQLEERSAALHLLQESFQASENEARQATIALAVARADYRKLADLLNTSNEVKAGLERDLGELRRLLDRNDLEKELEQLKTNHEEKLASLHRQLEHTAEELETTNRQLSESEAEQRKTLEESARSETELQDRLAATSAQLESFEGMEKELSRVQALYSEETFILKEQLALANGELEEVRHFKADLEAHLERLEAEIDHMKADHQQHVTLSAERAQAAAKNFENEVADLVTKHATEVGELQAELEHAVEGTSQLQVELQEEMDRHAREYKARQEELSLQIEGRRRGEIVEAELRQELATAGGQLVRTRLELQVLQEEKNSLQIESTDLEAEIQKSRSLTRFLEGQLIERELMISSLKDALECTRADLSRSEMAGKAAEVNLTLQAAQHKQVLAGLHREITSLQANPKLEEVIAELQEKNQEMEELLRNKCMEIEENDDRFIEMLKEKKKLTAKIDSLNRKVLSLQGKITAAKNAAATSASAPVATASSARHTPPMTDPPIPPVPTYIPTTPNTRTMRTVSGPSSLPRPKTPESRSSQPAVFKIRTPERRVRPPSVGSTAAPETSSAGKKRRAPEEWEEEVVPPQAFTTDCRPEGAENITPRIRRVLHSVHSGFTPARHSATRSTTTHQSPVRRATTDTPLIADLTNSPHSASQISSSAKASKRSWLGKIRGNGVSSSQGRSFSSARPGAFQRPVGEAS